VHESSSKATSETEDVRIIKTDRPNNIIYLGKNLLKIDCRFLHCSVFVILRRKIQSENILKIDILTKFPGERLALSNVLAKFIC
jgi:hypothetical protein